jgi:AraC-like DNA-binding protein
MSDGGTHVFGDPAGYGAALGCAHVKITITGAGNFSAQLTRLRLPCLEVFRCREALPRIAYISVPIERAILFLPIGSIFPIVGGSSLRSRDIALHSPGQCLHQRSSGPCQWGLISLPAEQLAQCGKALNGQPIALPLQSRILRPDPGEFFRFQHLFRNACALADSGRRLIERPEVARALEQEMLHSIVHCLAFETSELAETKQHHADVVVRFEQLLTNNLDQKLNMAMLCAQLGVADRTLRMCCAEILGVSPTRYILLRRLNQAREALQRADPSMATVAEVARDNQFLEFGRFAVTYRNVFGESPSTTLQRDPQA